MEIRRFKKKYYEDTEEFVFVKNGEARTEFYFFDDGDMRYNASVATDGAVLTKEWNVAIDMGRETCIFDAKIERYFSAEDHDDDEDCGETAEDRFDAAVAAAREWLYA